MTVAILIDLCRSMHFFLVQSQLFGSSTRKEIALSRPPVVLKKNSYYAVQYIELPRRAKAILRVYPDFPIIGGPITQNWYEGVER